MVKTYTTELAGRPLVMEFGKYCGQANGSVIVRLGDTVVMVNATASDTPREGQDFFPLSVDFEGYEALRLELKKLPKFGND